MPAHNEIRAGGNRRNPNDWSYDNVPDDCLLERGFTGHEHLDVFGLINMNGRMYDPKLGVFLSPDNYVQQPGNTQSYNRYTYALNNPLIYTDPSGEIAHLIAGAIIGGIINWAANGAEFSVEGLGYFGIGVAAGALSAGMGAGIGGIVGGAGSFSFSVANSLTIGGMFPGMAIGVVSGFTNGFITDVGNSLLKGNDLAGAIQNGISAGISQGISGGILGGIRGGIRASRYGGNILTGKRSVDLSAEEKIAMMLPAQKSQLRLTEKMRHTIKSYTNAVVEIGELEPCFVTTDELNEKFANYMSLLDGKHYSLGADGPSSFDCSGAVCHGIRKASNTNFGDFTAQELFTKYTIPANKVDQGVLFFYDWNNDGWIQHVTTAISKESMIHPSSSLGTIKNVPINYLDGEGGRKFTMSIDWFKVFN